MEKDCCQWRQNLGPITDAEALAWCYTASLLADFIDTIVLGKPGEFTRRVAGLVTAAEEYRNPGL